MAFTHDTSMALQGAVRLTNSALGPDTLTTMAELDAWCEEYDVTGHRDRDEAELEGIRKLRPRLYRMFTAGEAADTVELVNEMLLEARALPQLVRHHPWDWHLHSVPADAPLDVRISVETAMAMVDVIRADELSRLGVCADADCEGVVLDLSRNRSRRFCSTTCGNRNAVAAYRARHADD